MPMVRLESLSAATPYALVIHGGAGGRIREFTPEEVAGFAGGLRVAFDAGEAVLRDGGTALDAVIAAVRELEDCPLFNAGRGATLTSAGTAELDACIVNGDGRTGAVTISRHAKHPVEVARVVMEQTKHVLLVDPSADFVAAHHLEPADQDWFVTDARRAQLERVLGRQEAESRKGTVGAVALDQSGHVAAATSTGGMVNKFAGRVGDTPIVGAGTFARDGVVAISCTGDGESFVEGAVAHDVYARMAYGRESLADAVTATFATELDPRGATGGLIAVCPDGTLLAAHNSDAMFAAFRRGEEVETWV